MYLWLPWAPCKLPPHSVSWGASESLWTQGIPVSITQGRSLLHESQCELWEIQLHDHYASEGYLTLGNRRRCVGTPDTDPSVANSALYACSSYLCPLLCLWLPKLFGKLIASDTASDSTLHQTPPFKSAAPVFAEDLLLSLISSFTWVPP